jgi:hypothetical protein
MRTAILPFPHTFLWRGAYLKTRVVFFTCSFNWVIWQPLNFCRAKYGMLVWGGGRTIKNSEKAKDDPQ